MARDVFWIEECTYLFSTSHRPVFERVDFLKCYIYDVLVHSKGLLQQLAHLVELFKRLHEVNMKIHPKNVSLLSP